MRNAELLDADNRRAPLRAMGRNRASYSTEPGDGYVVGHADWR
jgi:hypothetical protein